MAAWLAIGKSGVAPANAEGAKAAAGLKTKTSSSSWLTTSAFGISALTHRGLMAARTPNLDKIAAEGMLFTDYYAEASCTAGRANFITGELPIRTGMTTVGQAGAPTGLPAQAVTIATALADLVGQPGQFGKNHLGDKNEFLPTVHGFDEFLATLSPRRDGRPVSSRPIRRN